MSRFRCRFALGSMLFGAAALLIPVTAAQTNLTPGDDAGADHTAFLFEPYAWTLVLGGGSYAKYVGTASHSGQRYDVIRFAETTPPDQEPPAICTVANFYEIIRNQTASLGTLLINAHGGADGISIEPFEKTPAGEMARDARFQAYRNGTAVAGLRPLQDYEIYRSNNLDAWAIGVTDLFIRTNGRLTRGLVYINACQGGTLADDFVAANARVAIGNTCVTLESAAVMRVRTFFSRMDGKQGQSKRPVSAARAGLPLTAAGLENTTLTPSVLNVDAPCPIKRDDIVQYDFDTTCEVSIIPDIEGVGCTIEHESWASPTRLLGICTAPPPPGAFEFSLILHWNNVRSDQNIARLDGNRNPLGRNAEGPAHDDHRMDFKCGAVGSDTCATATRPVGAGAFPFDLGGASTDGEPHTGCDSLDSTQIFNDIWLLWLADCTGTATIDTCAGPTLDTKIAVYAAGGPCPPGDAELIACNDDAAGCGVQSRVTFPAASGQGFLIRIGTSSPDLHGTGIVTMACTPQPPSNDACNAAISIVASPATVQGSTIGATVDVVPDCPTPVEDPGVWYRVVGTGNTLTLSLCGSSLSYDAAVRVYSGACGALTCVAANDDFCDIQPAVSWCSTLDQEYRILIHGSEPVGGDFEFTLADDGAPCVVPPRRGACCIQNQCSFTTEADCVSHGGEFLGELGDCVEWHGRNLCFLPRPADLNGDGCVDLSDLAILLSDFGLTTGVGDVDGDGDTDLSDLTNLLSAFGTC